MAEKTATVRLDLKDTGFRRGFSGAQRHVEQGSAQMGASMQSALSTAAKGGTDALKGMLSTIKSGFMGLGGIIGGIGFAGLVKGAMDSAEQFRKLSFTMGAGRGVFEDYRKLQDLAGQSAMRWAQDSTELGKALETVFNTVGDGDFAKGTLDDIAKAAQASGQSVDTIAPIVAELNRQFGITKEEVPNALAAVMSLGGRGGLSIEDMGAQLGKIGRIAGVAGLQGEEGLRKMLAMVNQVSAAAGTSEGSVEKLQTMLVKLTGNADMVKKNLGIDVKGLDAVQALEKVLGKTKGEASQLTKVFGEQGVIVAQAFGKRFQQVMEETQGKPEEKLEAAVEDFRRSIAKGAESALSASDVHKRATDNLKSPQAGINKALETLKQSFNNPEMQAAISKLAENLPALAEAVAKVVAMIAKHPALAAGVLGGATFAKGAMGAAMQGAMSLQGGKQAATGMETAIKSGGDAAALSMKNALALGVAGLAIPALGAAADQLMMFVDELRAYRRMEAEDNRHAIKEASEQGAVAERKKTLFGEGIIETGGSEYISQDEHGNIRTRQEKFGPLGEETAGTVAMRELLHQQGLGKFSGITGAPTAQHVGADFDSGLLFGAKVPGKAPEADTKPQTAAIGKAVSEGLSNKKLSTQVDNASAITDPIVQAIVNSGGPRLTGPPRPGSTPTG